MSDMTSDMMDTTVQAPAHSREHVKRKNGVEFSVYFAIIFVATLPLATLTWAMHAIKSRSFTDQRPNGPRVEPGPDHHADDLFSLLKLFRLDCMASM